MARVTQDEFNGIDSFRVPHGIAVDPVTEKQVRIVVQGDDSNTAWLVDKTIVREYVYGLMHLHKRSAKS